MRALDVHALADRLHDRFRLLGRACRDAPARQRTLCAVIGWSRETLSPPERTVPRRLSVLAGALRRDGYAVARTTATPVPWRSPSRGSPGRVRPGARRAGRGRFRGGLRPRPHPHRRRPGAPPRRSRVPRSRAGEVTAAGR
ncbi:hypothetical protein GCM10010420_01550 [Streptomyces glaucosporus]|uniref:Uncharacterized protein n=1 Tax=Streptomyces glaucosporus TaxID=284044 RepID=A0ABP5UMX0_9ACTN